MFRAVVIDDEQHCIDRLAKILDDYSDTIILVDSCQNIHEAKETIIRIKPDVVFLDVHIHEYTGFDLLKQFSSIDFEVVFTTAYDRYAINAFRFSALDYLLKPIDNSEFLETIKKLKEKSKQKETSKRLEVLFHNFEDKIIGVKKIAIHTIEGLSFIKIEDIIRFQADGNYTRIFLMSTKKITATKTIKYFEELLKDFNFFRIHKSHFINLNCIVKYIKGKSGHVLMVDETTIEIAIRRKEGFLNILTELKL